MQLPGSLPRENWTGLHRMRIATLLCLIVAVGLAKCQPARAQTPAPPDNAKPRTGLARWFEVPTFTISARYRFIENSAGLTTNNQVEHQEALAARLLFDPKARLSLNLGLASGSSFTGGWSATGWGTGSSVTNLYMKQLYLAAKPASGLEIQYGGLRVLRGESTEITTYDNDGYIVGQRASLTRPKDIFFDEISVTYAYLGDLTTPNLNKRFHRLKKSNYHQFLLSKNIGNRAAVSVDYTSQWGIETLREAIRINVPESRVLGSLRFENYQRLDVDEDFGFAVQADRRLSKRLTVGGGYADVDPNYGGLNADRFNSGRRVYLVGAFTIIRRLVVSSFYQHSVATDFPIPNRSRFDLVVTYGVF